MDQDRDEKAVRKRQTKLREAMRLYAVTDSAWLNGRALEDDVREALKGGATFIQIREKSLDYETFRERAKRVQQVCREYQVPFVVNDEVDLAKEIAADGVHIGQSDMELERARRLLGPDKIIGVSVRTVEQALRAEAGGADYLGVGAVFHTSTKADAADVSAGELRAICQAVTIPVVAIGGIGLGNIHRLAGSGIDGIAVVSAIFGSEDIQEAARELRRKAEELFARKRMILQEAKCAAFDVDGTLIDSMGMWRELGDRYLAVKGLSPKPGLWEAIKVLTLPQSGVYLKETYGMQETAEEIMEEIAEMVRQFYDEEAQEKPGALKYLRYLSGRGVCLCFATASERRQVEPALRRLGMWEYFDKSFTCTEVGIDKNTPQFWKYVANSCGFQPEDMEVYEDAPHAAKSAMEAGCPVTAVYDESSAENEEELRQIAHRYIRSYEELIEGTEDRSAGDYQSTGCGRNMSNTGERGE